MTLSVWRRFIASSQDVRDKLVVTGPEPQEPIPSENATFCGRPVILSSVTGVHVQYVSLVGLASEETTRCRDAWLKMNRGALCCIFDKTLSNLEGKWEHSIVEDEGELYFSLHLIPIMLFLEASCWTAPIKISPSPEWNYLLYQCAFVIVSSTHRFEIPEEFILFFESDKQFTSRVGSNDLAEMLREKQIQGPEPLISRRHQSASSLAMIDIPEKPAACGDHAPDRPTCLRGTSGCLITPTTTIRLAPNVDWPLPSDEETMFAEIDEDMISHAQSVEADLVLRRVRFERQLEERRVLHAKKLKDIREKHMRLLDEIRKKHDSELAR